MDNTIEKIVSNNLCIGCGTCAGVCPQQLLAMDFNVHGEYNPSLKEPCHSKCGLCLSVCPFNDGNLNENEIGSELFKDIDQMHHSKETGYYLDSLVGYSPEFRQISASGGMAIWLLTSLIEKDIVDYVICVAPQDNPNKLFTFQIFEDSDSLINSSGSAYYPVEFSDMIKLILDQPGRYAIIGLPCFIKAIRLAAIRNQKLKKRITVCAGLVCGQMKSKYYTSYLAELANAGGKLQKVVFRGKSPDEPADNYFFNCTNQRGVEGKVFWKDGVAEAFVNRWFTPNACNYCDDIFAELADVVFMDAWLPEYSKDSKGTSLVLVRSPDILDIFNSAIDNEEIHVKKIPVSKVVKSQALVIEFKRRQLSYRLYLAKQKGEITPEKRVKEIKSIGFLKSKQVKLKSQMQEKSRMFNPGQNQTVDIKNIRTEMHPYLNQLNMIRQIGRIAFPIRIIKKYVNSRR